MSAMSVRPARWNVAAARIRIAALTNSASVSATVLSIADSRMASRRPAGLCSNERVWTIEEWRYRLCGITVAPMMPIAM